MTKLRLLARFYFGDLGALDVLDSSEKIETQFFFSKKVKYFYRGVLGFVPLFPKMLRRWISSKIAGRDKKNRSSDGRHYGHSYHQPGGSSLVSLREHEKRMSDFIM